MTPASTGVFSLDMTCCTSFGYYRIALAEKRLLCFFKIYMKYSNNLCDTDPLSS
jgi:hypothetical protein